MSINLLAFQIFPLEKVIFVMFVTLSLVRYIKLMSRLTKRHLRHLEDSSANAATREHLDNLKRDVTNALKR